MIIIIIIIKRAYPNPCSGQRALALIGWFERAVILRGGTKVQKQQSHRSSFKFRLLDWRTGYLNWSPVRYRPSELHEITCDKYWGSLMLSRCYVPTLNHTQPTELCMWGCGYIMSPDFTYMWRSFHCFSCDMRPYWHNMDLGLKNVKAPPWASSIHNNNARLTKSISWYA